MRSLIFSICRTRRAFGKTKTIKYSVVDNLGIGLGFAFMVGYLHKNSLSNVTTFDVFLRGMYGAAAGSGIATLLTQPLNINGVIRGPFITDK
jgi:hypothetical protein